MGERGPKYDPTSRRNLPRINVPLTDEERKTLREAAEWAQTSVAELLRTGGLKEARRALRGRGR